MPEASSVFRVGSGCRPILVSGLLPFPEPLSQEQRLTSPPARISIETLSYVGKSIETIKGLENETSEK